MAIIGSNRQRFLNRFEPRHDGFAYRSSVYARAVHVSAEERVRLILDYDDRRSVFWIMLPAALPLTIALTMLAYAVDPSHRVYPATAWITLLGFPILLALWAAAGRRAMLRRRPYIDEGLAQTEIGRRERAQMSWAGFVLRFLPALLWSLTIAASTDASPVWRALTGLFGVVAFALMIREGYRGTGTSSTAPESRVDVRYPPQDRQLGRRDRDICLTTFFPSSEPCLEC